MEDNSYKCKDRISRELFEKNKDIKRIETINDYCISIANEDHTLMNPLRWSITKNFIGENVELCGYTIPHPSENKANIRIQMKDDSKQNEENLLKKLVDGLECLEAIGYKILDELDTECKDFFKE